MERQVLVTGGNSGIGLEMARACLLQGHRVVIAARSEPTNDAACEMLRREIPGAAVRALRLDLGDFRQMDQAAQDILSALPRVDRVFLNAGCYTHGLRLDANGLESMIGSMHFGHFRLMAHLLPRLRDTGGARVVVTSSAAHWVGSIEPASFREPSRHMADFKAYAQAKLANLLYARMLAQRERGNGIIVNAFHPGTVSTGIWRELPRPLRAVMERALITPTRGADSGVWLALHAQAAEHCGQYIVRRRKARSSAASRNMRLAGRLWDLSEEIAGLPAPIRQSRSAVS